MTAPSVSQEAGGSYARDLVVMPGGTLTILSGATVDGLKDSGGYVYILDGANVTFASNVIDKVNVNANTYNVFSGTPLTNATVAENGIIAVSSGGVVRGTTLNRGNATEYKGLYVYDCGIGNDRMHGGGGDDTFTFCGNWGTDSVE